MSISTGEPVSSGATQDLRTLVVRLTALILRVAHDVLRLHDLDADYERALREVVSPDGVLRQRASELLAAITDASAEELAGHGLEPGSVELRFKLAAFDAAVKDSRYRLEEEIHRHATGPAYEDVRYLMEKEPVTEARFRKIMSGIASAFRVGNSIVKSVADIAPGGAAYGELKDGVEYGVEFAADAGGIGKRLLNRFRRPRPEEHQ